MSNQPKPALVIGSGFHRYVLGEVSEDHVRAPLFSWNALLDNLATGMSVPVPPHALPPVMRWEEIVLTLARKNAGNTDAPRKVENFLRSKAKEILTKLSLGYPDNERSRIPLDYDWGAVISLNFDAAWLPANPEPTNNTPQPGARLFPNLSPRKEQQRLTGSIPLHIDVKQPECRLWFPNGFAGTPASKNTIRMGLRDYGFQAPSINSAINAAKRWERELVAGDPNPQEKFQAVCEILDDPTKPNQPPQSWVTHALFRPLLFFGAGLSENETGLWWLLTQRARNINRVHRGNRTPTVIVLHANDPRRTFWEQHPLGITPVFCSSWEQGWLRACELIEAHSTTSSP